MSGTYADFCTNPIFRAIAKLRPIGLADLLGQIVEGERERRHKRIEKIIDALAFVGAQFLFNRLCGFFEFRISV